MEKVNSDPSYKGAFGISLLNILYINQMRRQTHRFKICKERVLIMPVVIYTRKDFYLIEAINKKIEILVAAGLVDYWQFQDVDKQFLNYEKPSSSKSLTSHHMVGCFNILVSGLFASLAVFLYELLQVKVIRTARMKLILRKFLLWKQSV